MTAIRVATANTFDATVNRITQRSAELALTQERLSSRKRVVRASDDPVAATLAERESNRLMRTEADLRALERSRSSLQQAESTIGQMGEVLIRFKELLVQGGNASLSASDRQSVALEMRGLRDQLLNLANTQDTEGNALLGGLGTINSIGRPFVDLYTADGRGVQFQAIPGQSAATEVSLPNRVDGSFALMRNDTGNGDFVVEMTVGNENPNDATKVVNELNGILLKDINRIDRNDPTPFDSNNELFFVRVVLGPAFEGRSQVLLQVGNAPLDSNPDDIVLGDIGPGETIDLKRLSGRDSFRFEGVSDNLQIWLEGSLRSPDPLPVQGDPPLTVVEWTLTPSQPDGNMFGAMQRAIEALENPDANSVGRTQVIDRVHQEMQSGQDRLLLVRGRLGELLRRADSIEGLLQDRSVAGQRELSNLTDLDLVKGISEFQTQQLGLQAALQSYAQVQRLSLFQFIA